MDVDARCADTADDDDDEAGKLDEPELDGGGTGRCRSRKRMLPPVRNSEMCDVWKRSIIFWYLFAHEQMGDGISGRACLLDR